MFLGRRPGTAPVRFHERPGQASRRRRALDSVLAAVILVVEVAVGLSLWGPQPYAWVWFGSQVEYWAGSADLGIIAAFGGMLFGLLFSLAVLKRLDYAWKIVRRAAGHQQVEGVLELIFVVSLTVAMSCYVVYFFFIGGPYPWLSGV